MTAIRSVLGPHWDLYFDYGTLCPSLGATAFFTLNPAITIGGPTIFTADLSFLFDYYTSLIIFHKLITSRIPSRAGVYDDIETLRRYIILQQPTVTSLEAETSIKADSQLSGQILHNYYTQAVIVALALLRHLTSIPLMIHLDVSAQSYFSFTEYVPLLTQTLFRSLTENKASALLSLLLSSIPFVSNRFLSQIILTPVCILPSVQEIIGSLNLKFFSLSSLFLSLMTTQYLEIDSAYFSESVTVPKLLLHIQPWSISSQRFTESLEVEFIRKALLHSSSSFAEPLSIETVFYSDFKSVILSSLYLQPFVILPGIISLIIYQALSLLLSYLSEEYDVYQFDLRIQPYTTFTLWYLFSESLKWQLRSQTISRFVEEASLSFRSSAPQLPMFVYTALTLFPSAEFILPTPPARYPTFYDFVGSAWIFRKSFWHTYQKGWIDKDNVDETTYKRVGLRYPEGYEKLDRREKRKEIKIKTRRKKELSLEELNELL